MTDFSIAEWRIERRREARPAARFIGLGAALAGAIIVCGMLFLAAGAEPLKAFASLAKGSFGSLRATGETLVKATPLIFTGLAACVAFRARIWNIGAEGQVFAGAMFAYWAQHNLGEFPALVQIPVVVMGGIAGGGLYAALAGLLKTRFSVDEVISTVMLNYIIVYVLSLLLLRGPWSEAGGFFEQTARVDRDATLPMLIAGTRLHMGFLLALAAAVLVHLILTRTPLGYEIRAAGSNLRALDVQGTNTRRLIIVVMLLSGALAGLAGVTEVYGVHYRLKAGAVAGYGYSGIIVAILGQLHPVGVVAAAILFGALLNGATLMQIETGVPSALIYAIQAILLLFFLAGWAMCNFRLRRTGRV
ncbi:ABC transporter permease [Pseudaminobacter sp. 19-2017]|uniref:ABC transporter permease n=1 Tax=Pseudaminobacter soli (ex Zhang et al. 2022) TaxID=2831468 RepID=A0A942E7A8_9HYPH|nr:ABC transporter permease [Pseudaminobacter soli]MBS3652256.1 ABC transporter permease [Pseudaminobacter soli]